MTMTDAPVTRGRHAAPVQEQEVDLEIERLVEVGVPAGLPAGLGDNQGIAVRGSHRAPVAEAAAETDATAPVTSHLPWKLLLTGALALLVVLALAFVAIDAMAATWGVGAQIS